MQVYNDMPQRHAERGLANNMYVECSTLRLHSPESIVTGTAPVFVVWLASRGISAF
jgi:hypothetical protein